MQITDPSNEQSLMTFGGFKSMKTRAALNISSAPDLSMSLSSIASSMKSSMASVPHNLELLQLYPSSSPTVSASTSSSCASSVSNPQHQTPTKGLRLLFPGIHYDSVPSTAASQSSLSRSPSLIQSSPSFTSAPSSMQQDHQVMDRPLSQRAMKNSSPLQAGRGIEIDVNQLPSSSSSDDEETEEEMPFAGLLHLPGSWSKAYTQRERLSTTESFPLSMKRDREKMDFETNTSNLNITNNLCEVSSRASDEEDGASTRKKLRLTKEQSALLEESFKEHSTLNPKQKSALAKQLNLRPRQVEVWFQNRRARTKLKQTEVDCELLKRCCESLTEENRRLQKEVQELRALKMGAPCVVAHDFYMPLPAATLAMCPSCERLSTLDPSSRPPPKQHMSSAPLVSLAFNSHHPQPSAAC
ncbi:hypothetical protein KP509_04G036500 [Ceratopteris richardii]|uniref:Homeobox domain-containing protein n=1 Tax=Ceratopteris richardii TaxID=49495 RepID=A0A8T2V3Y1_CERRI|nr:hypothetical protein KP509_04G036500 [Ceratopteris richardii]